MNEREVLIAVKVPDGCKWSDNDLAGAVMSGFNYKGERINWRIIDNPAPAAQSDLLQYDSDLRYVQRVLEGEHPTRPDLKAARELVVKIRTCVRPAHTHTPSAQSGEAVPDATLSDGFGNYWARCGVGCEMEIVRPGKVQCDKCDNPRPANLTSAQPSVEGQSDWIKLAGAMYQAAGAYDMPVRVLDALSAAASGEQFAHLIDAILPMESPTPAAAPAAQGYTMQDLQDAFAAGFRRCADWADRNDLPSAIGSPAYLRDMATDLTPYAAAQPVQCAELDQSSIDRAGALTQENMRAAIAASPGGGDKS